MSTILPADYAFLLGKHSFWNIFSHVFSRSPRDYHYRWSIGKMVRMHLEDAILVGLYLLVLPVLFVLFVLWVAQYWVARWVLGGC